MKVQNMTNTRGNKVPNQFVIECNGAETFQSYDSVIAIRQADNRIVLDSNYWNYSITTSRYRNQFLGETIAETRKKIKSGEYILTNLN